jgi:hypothetical protein
MHRGPCLPSPQSLLALCATPSLTAAPVVGLARHIRPTLSGRCFSCYGPDESKRQAGLRLDTEDGTKELRGTLSPVVPGDANTCEILKRCASEIPASPALSGDRFTQAMHPLLTEDVGPSLSGYRFTQAVEPVVRNEPNQSALTRFRNARTNQNVPAIRSTALGAKSRESCCGPLNSLFSNGDGISPDSADGE